MKKRLLSVVAALVTALSLLTACGGGAASTASTGETASTAAGNTGDKIVMKISHVSSPGSARDLACQKLAEVVEEMTEGQVECQIYPSSQLGGPRDQVDGAQFGTIECVVVPTSYLGGTVPMLTLLDTPYLLPEDPEQLFELYQSDAIKALLDTT